MVKTLKLEGMTCDHCVAAVKEELGALAGVIEITVDLDTNVVTVSIDATVTDEMLRLAIEEAGYEVLEIA